MMKFLTQVCVIVLGLDDHGDTHDYVSNQHVDVDNNNDIGIDDPSADEIVNKSNILLRRSTR